MVLLGISLHFLATKHLPSASMDLPSPDTLYMENGTTQGFWVRLPLAQCTHARCIRSKRSIPFLCLSNIPWGADVSQFVCLAIHHLDNHIDFPLRVTVNNGGGNVSVSVTERTLSLLFDRTPSREASSVPRQFYSHLPQSPPTLLWNGWAILIPGTCRGSNFSVALWLFVFSLQVLQ